MTGQSRFGIIGCGRMGLRRIRAIQNHPEACVVGICDSDRSLAQWVAHEVGCPWFAEAEELLAHPQVDCIIICVPNKFHLQYVAAVAAAGKHIWCEKPLARTPEEAWQAVELSMRHRVTLKVGSNLRYFPSVLKAKELLDAGAFGETLFLRGWIGNAGWQLKSWFSNAEMAGGGAFLDNGSHLLDIARWFLGEAQEVTGFVATQHWAVQPLEDNGMGVFRFSGGKLAFIQACWTEWHEYSYIEVYGTQGLLRVDNRMSQCLTLLRLRNGQEQAWDYSTLRTSSYQAEMDDFIRALLEGRQPQPSGFDGLRAVQMAWGLYEASRTGRAVSLWGERERRLAEQIAGGFNHG
jgi:predicted dehydrogenase